MSPPTQPSFPRRREPRGAAGAVAPQPTPLTLSPAKSSFPRKREPRGAAGAVAPSQPRSYRAVPSTAEGSVHPARLEFTRRSRHTHPSFPRRREPRGAAGPVAPQPTPLVPSLSRAPPKAPFTLSPVQPSFRRKACPVLDMGPESSVAGAVTPQPTPLTLSPPKDPGTKLDGPEHDAPEHNAAGTETPGPPFAERPWGPSA